MATRLRLIVDFDRPESRARPYDVFRQSEGELENVELMYSWPIERAPRELDPRHSTPETIRAFVSTVLSPSARVLDCFIE